MDSLPGIDEAWLRPVVVAGGGSPVARTLGHQWAAKGVTVMADFGATEAGATILTMPSRGSEGVSTIGIPVIHAECSDHDLDCAEVPSGHIGELQARGPLLMQGYWNNPEETARAITPEGRFTTGDAARLDQDGIFRIVARRTLPSAWAAPAWTSPARHPSQAPPGIAISWRCSPSGSIRGTRFTV